MNTPRCIILSVALACGSAHARCPYEDLSPGSVDDLWGTAVAMESLPASEGPWCGLGVTPDVMRTAKAQGYWRSADAMPIGDWYAPSCDGPNSDRLEFEARFAPWAHYAKPDADEQPDPLFALIDEVCRMVRESWVVSSLWPMGQ